MTQTLRQRFYISRFLRSDPKRFAMKHIIAAFASLNPYRIRIEDGVVSFVPRVYCTRDF